MLIKILYLTNRWWLNGFDISVLVQSLDAAGEQ